METVKRVLIHKSNNNTIQFIRYGVVSCTALVVDFSCLVLLTEFFGINHLISALVGFIFGLLVNYLLSILWVFHGIKQNNDKQAFIVFTVIGIIGLFLTELIMWIMTDLLGIHYVISKVVSAIIVFVWNFTVRKKFVFN